MRRKTHQHGALVLVGCFLVSAALHALMGVWFEDVIEAYFARPPSRAPVGMVRLSPADWSARLDEARAAARRRSPSPSQASRDRDRERPQSPTPEVAKKPEPKPEPEERLRGQVVEVPPTRDSSPNPRATRLSKQNTHVEQETVARVEDRDPSRRNVTNRLQQRGTAARGDAVLPPGLTLRGQAGQAEQGSKDARGLEGVGTGSAEGADAARGLVFKVPRIERRDAVELRLLEGPGGLPTPSSRASDALDGNADRLELQRRQEGGLADAAWGAARRGDPTGSDEPALPSLLPTVPTLGTVANLSGSPSRDHVEGVPEGDGTFLNTKEFKYATFFYRVRDSVASHWEDLASREYRRRDPTGNIYGVKDRATLLQIRLDRDGRLDHVQVATPSGVDFLDRAAVEAFQLAQPFPNPPAGIADQDGSIRFNFQFVVTMRSRSPLNLFNFR